LHTGGYITGILQMYRCLLSSSLIFSVVLLLSDWRAKK